MDLKCAVTSIQFKLQLQSAKNWIGIQNLSIQNIFKKFFVLIHSNYGFDSYSFPHSLWFWNSVLKFFIFFSQNICSFLVKNSLLCDAIYYMACSTYLFKKMLKLSAKLFCMKQFFFEMMRTLKMLLIYWCSRSIYQ